MKRKTIIDKTHLRILLVRVFGAVTLTVEHATAAFWRVFLLCGFVVSLWLFHIPQNLGLLFEWIFFAVFLGGGGYFLWKDGRHFRFPSLLEIDRRIEKDSAIKGRPLSEADDTLANPQNSGTRGLWRLARIRLLALLPKLKPVRVKAFMAERDPYAMRLFVLMALMLGFIHAGTDWDLRIKNGLMPFEIGVAKPSDQQERFTLWITPPDYTALPQLVLNGKTIKNETLQIARGSTVKAVLNVGFGTPELMMGEEAFTFDDTGNGSYGLEINASDQGGVLKIKQGVFEIASWDYNITPDTAPRLAMTGDAIIALEDGELQFPFEVYDDYGVEYLSMEMTLDPMVEDAPLGENFSEKRSVISPANQDFEISPVYDLTAHGWAGLPVVFTFRVSDKAGQKSEILTLNAVLPEREFSHPIAKALVALRKKLAWAPASEDGYDDVSYNLRALLLEQELFHNDVVVYLGIRTAASRLEYQAASEQVAKEVMALLWDVALRIEDGDLSLAARRLKDAQMALEEALQDPDISEAKIARLMHDLRQAMAEYLTEMAREMQKRAAESGEDMPDVSPEMMSQMMNTDALSEFMAQMEAELRSGNKDVAQKMLSQMQRLMDMLNPSMKMEMPEDMQMMQQSINELQELIERQEDLLEQTEEQADLLDMLRAMQINREQSVGSFQAPDVPYVNTFDNRVEQEALRIILGQLMLDANDKIGEIPEGMGLAEQEMRSSSAALEVNEPAKSMPHQEQALAYLKESQQQMAQQLQQRMQQMTGFMLSRGAMQYDPFGRPYGGQNDPNVPPGGSQIEIPDEGERRRVQEILEILRRRAGEMNRPREEIEYYRRLLKRF